MSTPGIVLAARLALFPVSFYLLIISVVRFASKSGVSIPTWLLVLGIGACLPAGFALRIFLKDVAAKRKAAAIGARPVVAMKGERFGNIDRMLQLLEFFKTGYPGDGVTDAVDQLGPTFNFRVMYEDLIFTTEPQHIKTMLATDFENYVKGNKFRSAVLTVLGTGVFNSDGDMWKFHRSMTRPFFSHDRIAHFNIFDRHSEDAIKLMKQRLRAGYPIDFQDVISRFTLDSATEFLFGNCVHSLSAGLPYPYNVPSTEIRTGKAKIAEDFAGAFAQAQLIIAERPRKGWIWPLFELIGDKTAEPMEVVNQYIEPILREAVDKHTKMTMNGDKQKYELTDDDTLLDHLVRFTTDPVVLKDEILNIMIAGRDTTAGTLTFVVYFLATHPQVLARLREEILTKIGPTNRPTYDDIREMKYLRAVINETLRLFPAVPFNVRESVNAATWPSTYPAEKPFYIPAKTSVSYSVFLMHRRKDLWGPDAEDFDPDRFLDERLHKYLTPKPFIFLPFNAGPRICLGQQFAYNEMSFMIIRLLQNFSSMTLAPEAQSPETRPPAAWASGEGRKATEKFYPKMHLTMYAYGGLWVRMTEADNEIA
ncbi:cytochrome P450 [Hygrophoropsis aurantiaca]|uniref:Cytochrome P450 n=1 Tax=Hygrophoropsis aurantiaca TaxID=72124 RepID=A0ACB8AFH8_9AGAM|nr:cytochrome P450 [Hygrophoropsis aurantiaca]